MARKKEIIEPLNDGQLVAAVTQKTDMLFAHFEQVGYFPHQISVNRTALGKLDERTTEWAKDAVRKHHERQAKKLKGREL